MYQLWNSRVSLERTFVGFLRCMGEPLLILSREFGHVEKISERAKEFSNQQRHASLLSRQPMPVALVKKLL